MLPSHLLPLLLGQKPPIFDQKVTYVSPGGTAQAVHLSSEVFAVLQSQKTINDAPTFKNTKLRHEHAESFAYL